MIGVTTAYKYSNIEIPRTKIVSLVTTYNGVGFCIAGDCDIFISNVYCILNLRIAEEEEQLKISCKP